jgi:hypothetical protein
MTGPILRRVYMQMYDSKTGEAVPFTGKCLDCQAPTDEGRYHCPPCIAKYLEKNKLTEEQADKLRQAQEGLLERALLWMYNDAKPRQYQAPCLVTGLEFHIDFQTLGEMDKRKLIEPTQYRGVFKLTKKGEDEAARLLAQKR